MIFRKTKGTDNKEEKKILISFIFSFTFPIRRHTFHTFTFRFLSPFPCMQLIPELPCHFTCLLFNVA